MTEQQALIQALRDQIAALREQSAAIRDLAESNRAMIDLIAEDADVEAPQATYMDGTPIRS